jgi:hypothetical protein
MKSKKSFLPTFLSRPSAKALRPIRNATALRAHSIITSHFGISPSGYLCPMPHSQTPRNSQLFLWFCLIGSDKSNPNLSANSAELHFVPANLFLSDPLACHAVRPTSIPSVIRPDPTCLCNSKAKKRFKGSRLHTSFMMACYLDVQKAPERRWSSFRIERRSDLKTGGSVMPAKAGIHHLSEAFGNLDAGSSPA